MGSSYLTVQVIKGVGGLDHESWRAFADERRNEPARNFIDGDLIQQFGDISKQQQKTIAGEMGVELGELTRRVEELSRLH